MPEARTPASGVVLGGVGCTGGPACRGRLAATTDAGARWQLVTAPDVLLFDQAGNLDGQKARVSGVVFASARAGWLYGPALYATHDGGGRWRKLSLPGSVETMAVSAGTAYAVVSPPGGKPEQLFASKVGKNAWHRVGTMTAALALLAVSGKAAWFASGTVDAGSIHVWATANGRQWRKYAFACPASGHGQSMIAYGLSSVAAASPADVLFLCTGKAIMVGKFPRAIAITPNGKTAYVADASGVTPIRTATNTALPAIKVGTDPLDIAITPNGKTAYVSSNQVLGVSGTVTPINTATNKAGKAIRLAGGASLIAITPNGETAYVIGDNTVTPINTATNKAGNAIQVGIDPDAIAITPNGKTAYVANQGCGCIGETNADTVSVINTTTNKAGLIKGFTSPDYIAITPNGKTAYFANGSSDVLAINTGTSKLGRQIKVGIRPVAIAITP